jgi:hypothetical protein
MNAQILVDIRRNESAGWSPALARQFQSRDQKVRRVAPPEAVAHVDAAPVPQGGATSAAGRAG